MTKQYAQRDAYYLDCETGKGDHYSRHVMAMTKEKLQCKGDIAAELATRDAQIEFLLGYIWALDPEHEQAAKDLMPDFIYREEEDCVRQL